MQFKIIEPGPDHNFSVEEQHGFNVSTPSATFNCDGSEHDRARVAGMFGNEADTESALTPMVRLLQLLRLANHAFDAIPEEDQQRIIDWAARHPHSQGGGFDVSQLISAAQDDLQSILCEDAIRSASGDLGHCETTMGSLTRMQHSGEVLKSTEFIPGAMIEEVGSVMMQDIIGDYDVPDGIPEWVWVEGRASFTHRQNGEPGGVWEFVLNLSNELADAPDSLKPVLTEARAKNLSYLIFHQGT